MRVLVRAALAGYCTRARTASAQICARGALTFPNPSRLKYTYFTEFSSTCTGHSRTTSPVPSQSGSHVLPFRCERRLCFLQSRSSNPVIGYFPFRRTLRCQPLTEHSRWKRSHSRSATPRSIHLLKAYAAAIYYPLHSPHAGHISADSARLTTARAAHRHSRTRTGSEMASRPITLHKQLQDHKVVPVAIHHAIPHPHFRRRYVSALENIVG